MGPPMDGTQRTVRRRPPQVIASYPSGDELVRLVWDPRAGAQPVALAGATDRPPRQRGLLGNRSALGPVAEVLLRDPLPLCHPKQESPV